MGFECYYTGYTIHDPSSPVLAVLGCSETEHRPWLETGMHVEVILCRQY